MTGAIDVVENKSWVVIIKLSNKVFFSNLTSALLILRIAFYTYLKLEETVSELVKILPQAFSDNPNWIYNKIHKSTENATYPSVSSVVIFSTTIEYGTSSSSINS